MVKAITTTPHSLTLVGTLKSTRAQLQLLVAVYGANTPLIDVITHLEYVRPIYKDFVCVKPNSKNQFQIPKTKRVTRDTFSINHKGMMPIPNSKNQSKGK